MSSEVRFRAVDGPLVGLSALSSVERLEALAVPLDTQAFPQDIFLRIDASGPDSVEVPGDTLLQSAKYVREGRELLLGADGHTARFHGGFRVHRARG